jgi:ferric-dicitrate binding protein FerR (iron transport regulator)
MTPDLDWQTLDRVLAGDASPDEEERVRIWVSESPERQATLESLRKRNGALTSVDVERAWQRVALRTVSAPAVHRKWTIGWVAAAVVVIGVGSLVSARMLRSSARETPVPTSWKELGAPLGRRASVVLPDSTRVVLNAGTSLRYSSLFGQNGREVFLSGEAYFAVKPDSTRPFRVRANNAEIQDAGTSFVVRAYDSTHGTFVVVDEGAVGIAPAGSFGHDTVVVMPGVLARVAPSGAVTTTAVDGARYTGFAKGVLATSGLTLSEAVPMIERWYDVKIYVADSTLGKRLLTRSFKDERLVKVLNAIAAALDVDVRRSSRLVTISPRSDQ